MFRLENYGKFCKILENLIIISKVGGKLWRQEGSMEQYLSDRNQLHIFDNDNFSIIPKSIFSDNDNLPISCKNAEISAVDNFFDNIAHPYLTVIIICASGCAPCGSCYILAPSEIQRTVMISKHL